MNTKWKSRPYGEDLGAGLLSGVPGTGWLLYQHDVSPGGDSPGEAWAVLRRGLFGTVLVHFGGHWRRQPPGQSKP